MLHFPASLYSSSDSAHAGAPPNQGFLFKLLWLDVIKEQIALQSTFIDDHYTHIIRLIQRMSWLMNNEQVKTRAKRQIGYNADADFQRNHCQEAMLSSRYEYTLSIKTYICILFICCLKIWWKLLNQGHHVTWALWCRHIVGFSPKYGL